MGALSGDHSFLNTVTRQVIRPPKRPPSIHGKAASGRSECARPQVHAAVATTHRSRIPVLLTVPWTVITSPTAIWPVKTLSFRTGFEDRKILATAGFSR